MEYQPYMNQYGRPYPTIPFPAHGYFPAGGAYPGAVPYPAQNPPGGFPASMHQFQTASYMPQAHVQDHPSFKDSQLFNNPLQTNDDMYKAYYQGTYANPYPVPMSGPIPPKPPTGHFGSFLNSFKSQSGSLDINKMMDTAGQMMNALTQVSNMAKGLGSLFKG